MDFTRRCIEQLQEKMQYVKRTAPRMAEALEAQLEILRASPKFALPPNGRCFDGQFKGLPEELHLPFPIVVLEYTFETSEEEDAKSAVRQLYTAAQTVRCRNRIILASENPYIEGGLLVFSFVEMAGAPPQWVFLPYAVSIAPYSSDKKPLPVFPEFQNISQLRGPLPFSVGFIPLLDGIENQSDWEKNAYADLVDEANVTLDFIEAMSCSNVTYDTIPARRQNRAARRRGALPFDDYHVLVVKVSQKEKHLMAVGDATHRSPREHLRRGHVRIYKSGLKIWVQSCVVNPGLHGKIKTSYEVRP